MSLKSDQLELGFSVNTQQWHIVDILKSITHVVLNETITVTATSIRINVPKSMKNKYKYNIFN